MTAIADTAASGVQVPSPRTIFLTGASSGIGRAIAGTLAREGHRLALCARGESGLRAVATLLAGAADRLAVCPADAADVAGVSRAIDTAERCLGPIDTLVHSAGAAVFAPVEETPDSVWEAMLRANLTSLFTTVRALLPRFRERGRGHVIAILSTAARNGFAGSAAYTASKFGALGFLESLRAEVRRAGIHVTAVLPGATDTPIWNGLGEGWDRSRMMRPDQVAAVVAAILRDSASGMIEEVRVNPIGGSL